MNRILTKTYQKIDQFTEVLGNIIAWFSAFMVVIMVAIVLLRYGFNIGWIAMQESALYFHAFVFMLGCSYTLKHDGHVRVDIFYRNFSAKKQAWVNLLGCLLLLIPVTVFIAAMSFDYVVSSWQLLEGSREAGGLPGVFILKSLIPLLSFTLIIQAISEMLKAIEIILGKSQIN
jgi:TRAP-type mannitol/chloroaromatic compound transport system permease small subunit